MRNENIARLERETFDLVIIGGGITGAGIAQDSAARGLKVALLEKGDFASGTSSKSSKLIHGGLRYLRHFDMRLTREACAERNLLLKLAPQLIKPLSFLIPLYHGSKKGFAMGLGLRAYDLLSGSKRSERHRRIAASEALQLAPLLRYEKLKGGLVYRDATTDDARLTITVIKSAMRFGAAVANYARVVELIKSGGRVCGVSVRDGVSGREFKACSKVVVNASGVWIDQIRTLDQDHGKRVVYPSKGVHVVLPQDTLKNEFAVILSSSKDRRMLFTAPWDGVTLVGTTDTPYQEDLNSPRADDQDIDYVLESVHSAFDIEVKREQIISTYAGLRPLIEEGATVPSAISRKHKIFESPSGLITIAGGKLTTYRKMAYDVVDLVARRVTVTGPCITGRVPLLPNSESEDGLQLSNLDPDIVARLKERYGSDAAKVLEIAKTDPPHNERIIKGLPYIKAEIVYAVRYEMAITIEDVLARRTRILLQDKTNGLCCAEEVARIMAGELGWSEQEKGRQLNLYAAQAKLHRGS